ncbi:SLC13 family permease [Marinospirillum sp.]|uniref:SLC13 family permease n=1 Tax=Marinospirillum sp. TaxID=2183934 RepID=UPI003A852B20
MNTDLLITLGLLLTCIVMFSLNKPRMDMVGLLALIALPLTGVLTLEEALGGFSEASVLMIAGLFVIGEGLVRTGVAYHLGDWLVKAAGASEIRLLVLLMLAVNLLGSVMSSTGIVAIFIPVVLGIAQRLQLPTSRLMMPLAFAALISGMMTLVATPPNLIVHAELMRQGFEGFHFFAFAPVGVLVLLMAILYMLVARRWLQPHESVQPSGVEVSLDDLAKRYQLSHRERRLRVLPGSPLANKPLNLLSLRQEHGINIIAIERRHHLRQQLLMASPSTLLHENDLLLVDLADPQLSNPSQFEQLGLLPLHLNNSYYAEHQHELGLAEVALLPESSLPGRSILELGFRSRHRLNVVGLRRHGEPLPGIFVEEKLKPSDTLLVAGSWKAIQQLSRSRDYIVLGLPREAASEVPNASKAPLALLALAVMVVLMVTGWVPNLLAVLIACVLMGAFGCLSMNRAYQSIHWPSLVLIVGMLPFATALQKTGGIPMAAEALVQLADQLGPRGLMAALFVLTSVTSLFISNTATAILLAPIAVSSALTLGLSPYPFAMTVAIAASAAFMTPVSSPVNTLVLSPGGYRFTDFVKIGVPLSLAVLGLSVVVIPWLFPFYLSVSP